MRGNLILVEGLDRTGKSTQAELLLKKFPNALLVKFPDRSTEIGKIINTYLTNPNFHLPDQAAHLLFSANRWELAEDIVNRLNSGANVIMDRYIYSGIAYSLAKSHNTNASAEMSSVDWLSGPDKGLPKPDLTLFLTMSLDELARRKGWGEERYEKEDFQKKVKTCFLSILDEKDESIVIVDVEGLDIEKVEQKIWGIVTEKGVDRNTENSVKVFE